MKVLLKMEKETCLVILVAPSSILPCPAVSDDCPSSQDSNLEGSFDLPSFPSFSSEAGNLQPAHLAVLQGGFEKAGFSKKSSYRVCASK